MIISLIARWEQVHEPAFFQYKAQLDRLGTVHKPPPLAARRGVWGRHAKDSLYFLHGLRQCPPLTRTSAHCTHLHSHILAWSVCNQVPRASGAAARASQQPVVAAAHPLQLSVLCAGAALGVLRHLKCTEIYGPGGEPVASPAPDGGGEAREVGPAYTDYHLRQWPRSPRFLRAGGHGRCRGRRRAAAEASGPGARDKAGGGGGGPGLLAAARPHTVRRGGHGRAAGESRLTAAIPVENPCCSCKLTRVRSGCRTGAGTARTSLHMITWSMHKLWTVLKHDGPNHLGLW